MFLSSLKAKLTFLIFMLQATLLTRVPMLLLDTRLPYGSLIPGCEERLDPAGTGSFYNEGEADIVVDHIQALLATGISLRKRRKKILVSFNDCH